MPAVPQARCMHGLHQGWAASDRCHTRLLALNYMITNLSFQLLGNLHHSWAHQRSGHEPDQPEARQDKILHLFPASLAD